MAPRPHRAARLLLAALLTLAVACGSGGEGEDEAEDGGAEVEQDD